VGLVWQPRAAGGKEEMENKTTWQACQTKRRKKQKEFARRKNTTHLVEREDEHKKTQTNQFNQTNL